MKQIIYSSNATEAMDADALQGILAKARVHNASVGLTGMLVFSNGYFLQVLEGEPDAVDALYAKIAEDSRHTQVRTIMERSVAERDFPDWAMACRQLTDANLTAHPEFANFFSDDFDEARFRHYSSPARFLLLAFRQLEAEA